MTIRGIEDTTTIPRRGSTISKQDITTPLLAVSSTQMHTFLRVKVSLGITCLGIAEIILLCLWIRWG